VIVVFATDVPLEHRQLLRVIRRAGGGLARCGSFWGNGSGDVFVGFTTANRVPYEAATDLLTHRRLAEERIDIVPGGDGGDAGGGAGRAGGGGDDGRARWESAARVGRRTANG
jgi:hypothetical protein